jgi:hypothetical protein
MDDILPAILILAVIVAVAFVGFRVISKRGGSDSDSTSNFPNQEPRPERPLGDTPEAHDEINPHDLPLDHPGRDEAEEMAGGSDGTTRGPLSGG